MTDSGGSAQTRHSAAVTGLTAAFLAFSGLVLRRELGVVASGNELATAAGVGALLGWTAVGIWLGFLLGSRTGARWLVWLLSALPVLLVAEFYFARGPLNLLILPRQNGLILARLSLAACLLGVPLGLAAGLIWAILVRQSGGGSAMWPAAGGGWALGAAGFALSAGLGAGQVRAAAAACGAFACLVSALLGPRLGRVGKLVLACWTVCVVGAAVALGGLGLVREWELTSAARGDLIGRATQVLSEADLPDGNLVVTRGEGNVVAVHWNGVLRGQSPDPEARGEALFACGQAWNLGCVLVIGGGRPDLVRELLERGASRVDVFELCRGLGAALDPRLSTADRALLASGRIRRFGGNLRRFLRASRKPRYHLVVLDLPEPRGVAASALCSVEFFGDLIARLDKPGILTFPVPEGAREAPDYLARVYATLRDLRLRGTAGQPVVFPGKPYRFAVPARGWNAALTPREALDRYKLHRSSRGAAPPPLGEGDFSELIQTERAKELTAGLDARFLEETSEGAYLVPESVRTPRLHLDHLAFLGEAAWPRGAAALRAILRMPLWAPFAALWLLLMAGGLIARRRRGLVPGRFALACAAFLAGLTGLTALGLASMVYAPQSRAFDGALPLLLAALGGGMGLGASLTGRIEPALRRRPRRTLAAIQFAFLPLFLLGSQSVNLPPGSGWTDLAHGLGLVALGLLAGLELGALARVGGEWTGAERTWVTLPALAGMGAFLGAGLLLSAVLLVSGPVGAFLFLVGLKAAVLGLLAAGAGRPKGAAESG